MGCEIKRVLYRAICYIFMFFLCAIKLDTQVHEPDLLVSMGKADELFFLLSLRFEKENPFVDYGDANIEGIDGKIETVAGVKGSAAKFNGKDSFVSIPSHPLLGKLTKEPFTINFYLFIDKLPEKGDVGILGFLRPSFTIFTNPSGWLYAYIITEEQPWHIAVARGLTLTPGKWHHIRFSYDGKGKILWSLDGKTYIDEQSTKGAIKVVDDNYTMIIGRYHNKWFEGLIDELWIATGFNVMTEEQEKEMAKKSLVFYVPFDGTLEPEITPGIKKPLYYDENIRFTEGIKGQAVVLKGEGVAYQAEEIIHRDRGTIMFWFRGFDPTDYTARRYAKQKMFYEIGSWNEAMRLYWPGNGMGLLFYEFVCMGKIDRGKSLNCGFFHPEDRWVSPKKWHHIATTWQNGEEAKFYFDGRLIFTLKGVNLPAELSTDFVLGRGTPELHMDELRIYSEPLSPREIYKIYDEINRERSKKLSIAPEKVVGEKKETSFKPDLLNEPWFDNNLGEEDYVPPPWEPIKVKGVKISTWGATYDGGGILLQKVTLRDGKDILNRPLLFQIEDVMGEKIQLSSGKTHITGQGKGFCTIENTADTEHLSVSSKKRIEFDGFVINDIEITIKKDVRIGRIWLEIPLKREFARYYNICGTWPSYLGIPSGRIPEKGIKMGFEPYVWVGDEDRGFTFCTESNWYWINRNKNEVIDISYKDAELLIRINLCDEETDFKAGQKLFYKFGFMATPSRPFVTDRRLIRIGGLHPDNTRRGIEKRNTYVYLHWWEWSKPVMSLYLRTPDVVKKWEAIQDELSKKFKKVYIAPYLNFQKFGYQEKGEIEKVWYIKYKDVMERVPPSFNTWPFGGNNWGKTFNFCPNSKAFSDFFVWSFDRLLNQVPTLNGVYIDETFTYFCISDKHGCRGKNIFGDDAGKYPIFAHRELMKRIYIVAKKKNPDFLFWTHDSQFLKPPQRSFVDISSGGEPISFPTTDPLDSLPLDRILAEFLGRQFGVAQFYLPQVTKVKEHPNILLASERLVHLLFLHDIQIWGIWIHGDVIEDIWEACNKYGLDDSAEFIPYWEVERGQRKEVKPPVNKEIKVSVYKLTKGKGLIITVYNTGNSDFNGRIALDWESLGNPNYSNGITEIITGTRACKAKLRKIDQAGVEIELGAKDGMNIGVKPR